ncbi:NADH dehydrogenase [ubiquinone] 1 alpha subcomplex assembly factor 8 isoform X1 [Antechinus flavipes]|uniref:NADH dehydrogenase [ubiquinone] 1 alpha subcomplex assembly factor 8 isoform X1 n=1 Tax=Antechinus flavipes TaxID=38775 RepID=UPI002235787C|nr:NADH dehydrogenase [ubiquinone] 1 alpha subcomplex assembly factor 8 isoform X1 [Antechinus flavipes]
MQDGIPLVGKDKLMSGTGAVWSRVRSRIQSFPERLATCGVEAAAYGKCVQAATAPGGELRRNLCAKEFEALRNCFVAVVSVAAGPWPRRP